MSDSESSDSNSTKKVFLNQYQRRKICKVFAESGGGPTVGRSLIQKASKITKLDSFGSFINDKAKVFQEHVGEEVATEEFEKLEKWIEYFKNNKFDKACGSELPLLFKAISVSQSLPHCNSKDIDFSKLYAWLADVMQGNVPLQLNAQSQMFLVEQFQELLQTDNDRKGQNDLLVLAKAMNENNDCDISQFSSICEDDCVKSVDPLQFVFKKT